MKVHFTIEYHTVWGENLFLVSQDMRYPMSYTDNGIWSVQIDKVTKKMLSDYTYIVERDGLIERTEWKHHSSEMAGEIHDSWIDPPANGCPFLREHDFAPFDRPGYRGAGVAIPVFALRSESDFGVGEFTDIRLLADWAAATGQTIIQLLPVNDTVRTHTWLDSYPYNPVSSFALHPQYMNMEAAGIELSVADIELKKELNSLRLYDYERVNNAKERIMREFFATKGRKQTDSAAYRKFCKENSYWLDEYAEFCVRRDESSDAEFYRWQQFHLDAQLSSSCRYAASKGVALKGDLPIGVSRDSVEAHTHPECFNLDSQTGAPPDYFSDEGQNWGFPTYNWIEMSKNGFLWWKKRLRKMARYFSAFRIDHILGLFRIWEIPSEYESGSMGHFYPALPYSTDEIVARGLPFEGLFIQDPREQGCWHPLIIADKSVLAGLNESQRAEYDRLYEDFFYHRHNDFWKRSALKKLPELLSATGMLACGEDLGMIPACVPDVMADQRILSFEMQRMPKEMGVEWADPSRYPRLSVCSTSSHDLSSLRMWWHEDMDPAARQRYYKEMLKCDDEAPSEMTAELCRKIIMQHLASPSMLVILPLQDWTALDEHIRNERPEEERINLPSNPRNYWHYRMHLTLERLNSLDEFNAGIAEMIAQTGR